MPAPRSLLLSHFAGFSAIVALAAGCSSSTRPAELPAPATAAAESHRPKRERTPIADETTASRRAKTALDGNDGKSDGSDKADPDRERGFPADELRTAMRAASDGLTTCADSSAHTFQAALRIETSGRVSRVDIIPAGGAEASCIQARLLELSIRPFSGDSVTIMMPVTLPAR